jgi:hypothetical protein
MSTSTPSGSSLGKRAIAVLILLVAAWILFKAVIGIAVAVFWVVLVVAAVIAVIWAIRVL